MLLALLSLLITIVVVLGQVAREHIRARTIRQGYVADVVRDLLQWWRGR